MSHASPSAVKIEQHIVICFLVHENVRGIHKHSKNVYCESLMSIQYVRKWVIEFYDGWMNIFDEE